DVADHVEHAVELLVVAHLAPRRPHADAGDAGGLGPGRDVQHLLLVHQRAGLDLGLVPRRLRAVRAVLRAAAGLDGNQLADLHLPRVLDPAVHAGGAVNQVQQGQVVDLPDLVHGPVGPNVVTVNGQAYLAQFLKQRMRLTSTNAARAAGDYSG